MKAETSILFVLLVADALSRQPRQLCKKTLAGNHSAQVLSRVVCAADGSLGTNTRTTDPRTSYRVICTWSNHFFKLAVDSDLESMKTTSQRQEHGREHSDSNDFIVMRVWQLSNSCQTVRERSGKAEVHYTNIVRCCG